MAEMEEDVDLSVEEEVNDTEDTPETDDSETVTYEQAMEWKKKAERLDKAEKKLVEQKKALKEKEKQAEASNWSAYITKEELAIERFIDKNPDMEDYRDELVKYINRGNTLTEAKLLIENSDKTIANRKKTDAMNITHSDKAGGRSSYTADELEKMPQKEYNRAMEAINKGTATLR